MIGRYARNRRKRYDGDLGGEEGDEDGDDGDGGGGVEGGVEVAEIWVSDEEARRMMP